MQSLAHISFLAACIVGTYVCTWSARLLAPGIGLLDIPDGRRKVHGQAVPLGGAALVVCMVGACTAAVWLFETAPSWPTCWPLLLSVSLLGVTGLWDDYRELSPQWKLLAQTVSCLPFVIYGECLETVGIGSLQIGLGWFAMPVTLLWLLLCVNSFNLIDGLDGLASCLAIVASATISLVAFALNLSPLMTLSLCVAACIVGFTAHNWPPARTFLGDAGALPLGLILGALLIQLVNHPASGHCVFGALLLLQIPLFDTAMAILRRTLASRPISEPDQEHIHHCLCRRGFSQRSALLLLSAFSVVMGISAAVVWVLRVELFGLFVAVLVPCLFVVCRWFGYQELQHLLLMVKSNRQLGCEAEPIVLIHPESELESDAASHSSSTLPNSSRKRRAA